MVGAWLKNTTLVLVVGSLGCTSTTDNTAASDARLDGTADVARSTTYGPVRGTRRGATAAYLGVPFAAPPVGPLRWRAPAPPTPWTEPRAASVSPAKCAQVAQDGSIVGDEDCLYLNVWTPLDASPQDRLPVMFFVHGGGNMFGSVSEEAGGIKTYDGQALAERAHAVVITTQYRLNVFGYLAHPAFADAAGHHASGNYGLMDQVAALRWAKDNARTFGGDPGRVLLFGESGGASDVCAQVASPLAKGLFSSAIMESGSCRAIARLDAEKRATDFATTNGCGTAADPAACLRAVDARTLLASLGDGAISAAGVARIPYSPSVDGYVLPDAPRAILHRGEHNHVPFVLGVNLEETRAPLFAVPQMTRLQYWARVRAAFPNDAERVLARYPVIQYDTPRDAWIAMTTDGQFTCPNRQFARDAAATQHEPVYRYLYSQVFSGQLGALGAAHGLELYFVFQHVDQLPSVLPRDRALERSVLGYWSRLAANGDPNGDGAVVWPRYRGDADDYLELGTPVAARAGMPWASCDLWDSLDAP